MLALLPPWLRRWGISLVSLALGVFALFVFRRGMPHVAWIVGYLLLLWMLFAVLAELRTPLEQTGHAMMARAADYTIQTLYHNLLLFVLPAYYASATFTSVNVLFLVGVAAGAVITAVDPLYSVLVRRYPSIVHAFLGFSIFAALNVALPLVGVPPIMALEGSAALAGLALTPAFRRRGAVSWTRAHGAAMLLAVVAVVTVWYARVLVPPAPLFVTRAVAARDVAGREPVDEIRGSVSAATLAGWGGLVAYTAVRAPAGLRQAVAHVWRKDGAEIGRISLSPIEGGRPGGFRTFSRRTDLRPPLHGRYTVDVVTASGQLIGRLRFTVTP